MDRWNPFPTHLPSLDVNVGERVLPPVLLKRLLLLPLDGLGVIVLINPLLRPQKVSLFQKMPSTNTLYSPTTRKHGKLVIPTETKCADLTQKSTGQELAPHADKMNKIWDPLASGQSSRHIRGPLLINCQPLTLGWPGQGPLPTPVHPIPPQR